MSRIKYTNELAQRIKTLAAQGKTNSEIATSLRMGTSTLLRWIQKHEELQIAVARRDYPDKFREQDIRNGVLDWLLEDIKSRGETVEIIERDDEAGLTRKTKIGNRVPAHYLSYLEKLQERDEEREFTITLTQAFPDGPED